MPVYKAPVEDVMFLLNDVFPIERHNNLPGFADATPDTVEAILTEGAKLCEEVFAPLNRTGDLEGCTRHADGSVTTPKGFKEAYEAYAAGGWMGLAAPEEYGGQGLPSLLNTIMQEFVSSSNLALGIIGDLMAGQRTMIQRVFERVRRVVLELDVPPSHYEPGARPTGQPATVGANAAPHRGRTEEREALKV